MTWALIAAVAATCVTSLLLFLLRPRLLRQEKRGTYRALQVLVIVLAIITAILAISDFIQT